MSKNTNLENSATRGITRTTISSDHDRGDGHPSSLESDHHLDQQGIPIYSPAQKHTLKQHSGPVAEVADVGRPAFLDHVNPAHNEPERFEALTAESQEAADKMVEELLVDEDA